jgi:hypothetical protein
MEDERRSHLFRDCVSLEGESLKTSKVRERIMATACSEKTTNVGREFLLKALRIVSLLASAVGWFWAALYLSWGNTDAGTEYYNKLARQARRLDCDVFSSLIRNISWISLTHYCAHFMLRYLLRAECISRVFSWKTFPGHSLPRGLPALSLWFPRLS